MEEAPTKKKYKTYNRKYDKKKVKALAKRGVTATDIAKTQDVDVSTITRYLQKIGIQAKDIKQYRDDKADALALSQLKMATVGGMIVDKWLEEPATILSQDVRTQKEVLIAVNSVKTFDNNSERLEREQATQIIRYDPDSLRDRYAELRGMMDAVDMGEVEVLESPVVEIAQIEHING